jgi:dTDP-4-amino-4,6-dideoxygalactose transaminase
LTQTEEREVRKVLRSGWITSGPAAGEFEKKIKEITGAKYAIAVSSCTAGLHLTLEASGIRNGDEVITTPFTMAATIEAILYCGAIPVFADINPATLNIDPTQIRKKITKKTKAILTVDMAGWPCDYDQVRLLAKNNKLILIEDAAHSLGGYYKNKPIGSIADATVFSFYSTKNVTTGEGGMVTTNQKNLADRIRHLSLHGMTSSGWRRYFGGGWKYDITALGYKYNLSDLAAGLGLGQLARFSELQDKRQRIAERYFSNLIDYGGYIEPPYQDNISRHAWHLFIIKLNSKKWKIGRNQLIIELEKNGVGCGVHFIPVYRFSYFKKLLRISAKNFPHSENSYNTIISLPFYPDLKYSEVDYVCEMLIKLIGKYRR